MEIKVSDKDSGKYIELIGNLDGGSSDQVTEQVLSILEASKKIIIDMEECLYVSSAGLRTLLTIGKNIKMKNGDMTIINLSEEVKDVMEMTGFSGIFKGFE